MCKSITDSVISGSLSYFTAACLILTAKPEYIWLGFFVFIVGSMQWIDAIIWYFKSKGIPSINVEKYGIITILILEPLIAYLGYVYYTNQRLIPYEIVYGFSAVFMVYTWIKNCEESTITNDRYLKWCNIDFNNIVTKTIYILLLFVPFLYFPDKILMAGLMITAGSLWIYNLNNEAFGSKWCHSFYLLDILILLRLLTN